ncbi:MAG: hypothetical protein RL619_1163 [Bacteroidota bacterium]|jgi:hypothetical protein
MICKKILDNQFLIRNTTQDDVIEMEYLQSQCYPTLYQSVILDRNHFSNHIKIFPEGQIVEKKEGKIVASASTFRCNFPKHDSTFLEETDNLWLTNFQIPNGDWMYGIDMGVLPEYRGLGLCKEMYKVRMKCVKTLESKDKLLQE